MSYRTKVENFDAKGTVTTRISVRGLGVWTSIPQLEREFDRVGPTKKIEYVKEDNDMLISYMTA